jgi:hypothetical protein
MATVDILLLLLAVLGLSAAYIARSVLILIGVYKDPILRQFEKYGDDESIYYPIPFLLLAMSIFAFTLAELVSRNIRSGFLLWLPGILLLVGAVLLYERRDIAERYPQIFLAFPRWYHQLREDTNRLERRRIAYMWLRLPWRTQLIYNSNSTAFLVWADLIVMGTVM